MSDSAFTDAELDYLGAQRLGRLATVSPAGAPQNNPVGFTYNEELGTIDVFGLNLAATRKYRNVAANGQVALVVDDLASVDPCGASRSEGWPKHWTASGLRDRA